MYFQIEIREKYPKVYSHCYFLSRVRLSKKGLKNMKFDMQIVFSKHFN